MTIITEGKEKENATSAYNYIKKGKGIVMSGYNQGKGKGV